MKGRLRLLWFVRKVCSSRIDPGLMGGNLIVCRCRRASKGFGIGLFPGGF